MGTFAATPAIVVPQRGYPSLYRPRNPRAIPLFLLVESRYEELKALWEDRFEKTHGFWRGFTDTAVARYLDCASPECGFARLRCDSCHSEKLLAFSCRQRGICPSCDAKRAAAFAAFLNDEVLEDVPHAMWVFTLLPLRLNPAREEEIVEELSQHLDQRYEELRNGGASDPDAGRLAIEELLEPGALADFMRPLRQSKVSPPIPPGAPGRFLLGDLWQDLRYAARILRMEPGFAAAAVLTLALGIGANSAIFALVDAALLRPLPFPDPERLAMVWERSDTSLRGRVSPLNLIDWNERNRTFDRMAGFLPNVGGMVMNGADGTAETVPRQWVTAGIFDVLGVRPVAGRVFLSSDDSQRSNVVVLSEPFWQTRFDSDPEVIGREIRLDGTPYTVVGVVSNESQLLGRSSIWALIPIQGAPAAARVANVLQVIGRLKPDVTFEAADADMSAVAEGLAREFPQTNEGRGVMLEPMHDAVIGSDLRLTSMLFLGVVAFVLLICCANVANLLLARAIVRSRELAIRAALGAGGRRVMRQLLTESLLLSTIGGVLGMGSARRF